MWVSVFEQMVRRLVVMTRFVCRPARVGFTITLTRRLAPLLQAVAPTIRRIISPAATVTSSSPSCKALRVTRPGLV
jgi:hypothetical protein